MRLLISLLLALPLVARASQPIELTEDQFKMMRQYQLALDDPRVQKMKPEQRMPAIARDAGLKLKELQAAVAKGEAAGDVKAKCEGNIQEGAQGAPFAGRVVKVSLDAAEAHAVAYVQWLNENPGQLEEEASLLARRTADACPIASSIQIWAHDKGNPKLRVFQALISRAAAERISLDKVKDFAQTRYIKLFEKVKNAAKGDAVVQ
jgi:hypothetical protein